MSTENRKTKEESALLTRREFLTRIGIGDRPGYVTSHFYTEGFLLSPTVILDGEVLFDHGRTSAFDDPIVREVARKYGDPDQILARIP